MEAEPRLSVEEGKRRDRAMSALGHLPTLPAPDDVRAEPKAGERTWQNDQGRMDHDRDNRCQRKLAHRAAADYFARKSFASRNADEEEYARQQEGDESDRGPYY